MSRDPEEITKRIVVVPEGRAEEGLVIALRDHHAINDVQVKWAKDGEDAFVVQLNSLELLADMADIMDAVVIVTDNDDDPPGKLKDVQAQIKAATSVAWPVPPKAWDPKGKGCVPSMVIATLPGPGENGTIETLIMKAMDGTHDELAKEAGLFIAKMPTGQPSEKLTTREKACMAALIAATCKKNPACNVQDMWQSNKGFGPSLLDHAAFTPLVDLLKSL